jgi:hypothetical protein
VTVSGLWLKLSGVALLRATAFEPLFPDLELQGGGVACFYDSVNRIVFFVFQVVSQKKIFLT